MDVVWPQTLNKITVVKISVRTVGRNPLINVGLVALGMVVAACPPLFAVGNVEVYSVQVEKAFRATRTKNRDQKYYLE